MDKNKAIAHLIDYFYNHGDQINFNEHKSNIESAGYYFGNQLFYLTNDKGAIKFQSLIGSRLKYFRQDLITDYIHIPQLDILANNVLQNNLLKKLYSSLLEYFNPIQREFVCSDHRFYNLYIDNKEIKYSYDQLPLILNLNSEHKEEYVLTHELCFKNKIDEKTDFNYTLMLNKNFKLIDVKFLDINIIELSKGKELLDTGGYDQNKTDSFVFISEGKYFTQSTAALKVLKALGGRFSLLYAFIVVPKFIRDAVYSRIAKNRYKLFGKRNECMMPTPELRSRFLE